MSRVKLTETQRELIVTHIINEMVNEGAWENVKYNLSKLGRYKAGGKFFNKGQVDADAKAKIQALLDAKGNEVIKRLDDTIQSSNPEFPNNKKNAEFLDTVMTISAVYDSIIAATHKDPMATEYLPPDAANALINNLRDYVQKFLDIDLKAVYSVVDEAFGIDEDAFISDPEDRNRKEFDKGSTHVVMPKEPEKAKVSQPNNVQTPNQPAQQSPYPQTPLNSKDVRQTLQGKRGGGDEFPSSKMKDLNVKPSAAKTLGATGAFLGLQAILGPIAIVPVIAGGLVSLFKAKGLKQSRAKTLNDLYQSLRNVEGGSIIDPKGDMMGPEIPNQENVPRGTDQIYNNIRNLFQSIVNQRIKLGYRAGANTGTGAAINKLKVGDKKMYNNKAVEVMNPDINGRVQVKDVNKPTTVFTVKPEDIKDAPKEPKKSPLGDISRFEENLLDEGRYIKDKRTEEYLQKSLSPDKLKAFEEFLNRLEIIRNQLKKFKGDDKILTDMITKLNANPIMGTDFQQMFNIPSDKAKEVASLKYFINDLFISVYSSKYKYASMIDKIAGIGGNINKLEENFNMDETGKAFNADAQDRGRFKGNLLSFLTSLVNIFQYLRKTKANWLKGTKNTPFKPNTKNPQPAAPQGDLEYSGQKVDVVEPPNVNLKPGNVEIELPNGNQIQVNKDEIQGLHEELKKIKKLMNIV